MNADKNMELPPELANVMVSCPWPGANAPDAMRFVDFLQTEQGQKFGPDFVSNALELESAGIDREKAIGMALGPAAIKDELGNLLRAPEPEQVPVSAGLFDLPSEADATSKLKKK